MNTSPIDIEKGRTSGDGMEQEEEVSTQEDIKQTITTKDIVKPTQRRTSLHRKDNSTVQENIHARVASTSNQASATNSLPLPGLHTLYRRPEALSRSLAPIIPKGELVPMTPRLVNSTTTLPEHKKTKPPKFIPYEPYPGAVNPIIEPVQNNGITTLNNGSLRINKNNLDIAVLVRQMSTMRTQELHEEQEDTEQIIAKSASEESLLKLRNELKAIQEERDYFQSQFKFQTKVNAELKNLLVASVGEDLQTRVNVLTEDKLQLARALLDTANNLTTHTEQIEFLAGQCEVWRSKFLASSVMVEELARWKADLTQRNQMLTESNKKLLQATHQIRDMQLEVLKNLKFLAKIRYLNLPATDVVNLSAENLNIVQQMVLHSGVGMPENLNISSASTNPLCEAEKYAVQALEFMSQPLMATDEAMRALFGQAQRPYVAPNVGEKIAPPNSNSTEVLTV